MKEIPTRLVRSSITGEADVLPFGRLMRSRAAGSSRIVANALVPYATEPIMIVSPKRMCRASMNATNLGYTLYNYSRSSIRQDIARVF